MARNLHLKQGSVTFAKDEPFRLECGGSLSPVAMRYAVYGEPNDVGDNVVMVCHALSGSARMDQWWPELFATDGALEDEHWCVICTNILGSCYGSTGPTSVNPATGKPYGDEFPLVTVGDTVRAQARVLDELGIDRLRCVLGGSIGGMQAIEWAIRFPERVDSIVSIGVTPLGASALALNHIQRQAIALGDDGLRIARAIGMWTYKSHELFECRHGRRPNRRDEEKPWESKHGRFDIGGYLDHQGDKFVARFDKDSYVSITRFMDVWDPERTWGADVWERIQAKAVLVGISSDVMFPAKDVRALAERIKNAGVDCAYREIESEHGHDAFLAEPHWVNEIVTDVLNSTYTARVVAANSAEGHDGAIG